MSIPTVRRSTWHRNTDRWQVQEDTGRLCATHGRKQPTPEDNGGWCSNGTTDIAFTYWRFGPTRKAPKDFRLTLRRIATTKKAAKA
jgi:hypothetical protein